MPERMIEEICCGERVILIFSKKDSALRMIDALLLEQHEVWSTVRKYLDMEDYKLWREEHVNAFEGGIIQLIILKCLSMKTLSQNILTLMISTSLLGLQACSTTPVSQGPPPTFRPINSFAQNTQAAHEDIIVKFKIKPSPQFLSQYAAQNHLRLIKVSALGAALFRRLPGSSEASLQSFSQHKMVGYTQKNYIYHHFQQASDRTFAPDPLISEQDGLRLTGIPEAWRVQKGRPETVIAIVDSGIDLQHPDLREKLVPGFNAINKGQTPPHDENGHGTHCAGTAAAQTNNGIGIAGACPECFIMPIKVLNADGSGTGFDVAEGVLWAADHGAKVINLSLGGIIEDPTLSEAIDYALQKGVVVVAAAGNDSSSERAYPAAHPAVIAVGSISMEHKRSSFSNYGNWLSLMSPGESILSTMPTYPVYMSDVEAYNNSYDRMDGTSMAAPLVSGVAGLLVSEAPQLSPVEVKAILESSSKK